MSLLHESSREILAYLDTQLKRGWCLDCIAVICRLKLFGFTAPWLITWIGDQKFPIIKYILEDIKDGFLTNPKIMINDLHYIGAHWSELDIIMNSINAEQQKPYLREETVNDSNYGGWIDARDKKIHYVAANASEGNAHSELARDLGAPASKLYDWMFENNYVRFVTEHGHRSSLSLEGMFDDIKSTFKLWWPQARKVDDLYIDVVKGRSFHFTVNTEAFSRSAAMRLFGPPRQD